MFASRLYYIYQANTISFIKNPKYFFLLENIFYTKIDIFLKFIFPGYQPPHILKTTCLAADWKINPVPLFFAAA